MANIWWGPVVFRWYSFPAASLISGLLTSRSLLRMRYTTVMGGEVVKARRLEEGKNVRWEITVRPISDGAVTVVLPLTTDCTLEGAICTEDRMRLSNRLEVTVHGSGG